MSHRVSYFRFVDLPVAMARNIPLLCSSLHVVDCITITAYYDGHEGLRGSPDTANLS